MEYKKGRKRDPQSVTGVFRDILMKMEINEESSYPRGGREFSSIYPLYQEAKRMIKDSDPEREYVTTAVDELLYIKRTK